VIESGNAGPKGKKPERKAERVEYKGSVRSLRNQQRAQINARYVVTVSSHFIDVWGEVGYLEEEKHDSEDAVVKRVGLIPPDMFRSRCVVQIPGKHSRRVLILGPDERWRRANQLQVDTRKPFSVDRRRRSIASARAARPEEI